MQQPAQLTAGKIACGANVSSPAQKRTCSPVRCGLNITSGNHYAQALQHHTKMCVRVRSVISWCLSPGLCSGHRGPERADVRSISYEQADRSWPSGRRYVGFDRCTSFAEIIADILLAAW